MQVVHIAYAVDTQSASYRLHKALLKAGVVSYMLVADSNFHLDNVVKMEAKYKIKENILNKFSRKVNNKYYNRRISKKLGPFSMDTLGYDVLNHPLIKSADIIHLHWIVNTLSIKTISRLLLAGKKVIWTCHDNWPFTGGCHVRYECNEYQAYCLNCPYSMNHGLVAKKLLSKRIKYLMTTRLVFTGPSNWMVANIKKSVFYSHYTFKLPNCVDTEVYRPRTKLLLRELLGFESGRIIIGVSVMDTRIPYKGWSSLVALMMKLNQNYEINKKIEFLVIGNGIIEENLPFKIHRFGYLTEEHLIAEIYNVCDLTINPSLEESFSNVVLESISCGVPVLAFAVGGIPDIIEHKKNGYLAVINDIDDLYNGFLWILNSIRTGKLMEACRSKAVEEFSMKIIADKAKAIYDEVVS